MVLQKHVFVYEVLHFPSSFDALIFNHSLCFLCLCQCFMMLPKSWVTDTKLLTCCFLYKMGMEKTAITAVQQRRNDRYFSTTEQVYYDSWSSFSLWRKKNIPLSNMSRCEWETEVCCVLSPVLIAGFYKPWWTRSSPYFNPVVLIWRSNLSVEAKHSMSCFWKTNSPVITRVSPLVRAPT